MACHHGNGYHDLILLLCTMGSLSHPLSLRPTPTLFTRYTANSWLCRTRPFSGVYASWESVWKVLLEVEISLQLSGIQSRRSLPSEPQALKWKWVDLRGCLTNPEWNWDVATGLSYGPVPNYQFYLFSSTASVHVFCTQPVMWFIVKKEGSWPWPM